LAGAAAFLATTFLAGAAAFLAGAAAFLATTFFAGAAAFFAGAAFLAGAFFAVAISVLLDQVKKALSATSEAGHMTVIRHPEVA
jgi:hypothetical protein